jgi:2-dehydro-3-deoxyphosphogluconate aldolase/(4S)-4-hydroxy-2-oxoglutarate aldolase
VTDEVTQVTQVIRDTGVLPVLTIHDAADAPALADALLRGGLTAMEITLRTPSALDAIERVRAAMPDAVVGAGSVTTASNVADAVAAGASFLVSPGLDSGVLEAARDRHVLAIPGIATATELLRAVELGVDLVKLFPAEVIGGPTLIEALSAVWPDVEFLPTGGITEHTATAYLALPQVLAVGGSWMAPHAVVTQRDWDAVTAAAAAARRLGRRR